MSALVAVVLALAVAALWAVAEARAERLERSGVAAVGQVVEHLARGKSRHVVLRLSPAPGEVLDVPVRVDGWSDPFARYPLGSAVPVRHAPGDASDLRTAATTPGTRTAVGVFQSAAVGAVVGATLAVPLHRGARRLEQRLQAGSWVAVPVEPGEDPDGGPGATVTDPTGARLALPPETWPFPARVEVLREPPGPTALVRLPPRPGQDLGTLLDLPRRTAAGRARSPRGRRRRPTA